MPHQSIAWASAIFAVVVVGLASSGAEPNLFESRPLTTRGEYTKNIEGPAVDAAGNLYVVNLKTNGTIGKVTLQQLAIGKAKPGTARSELFATLLAASTGNGIRFDRAGRMYVADFTGHNVLVIEPGKAKAQVYFHSGKFNQPNDLAIAADGTLYASDPGKGTGQIWRITRDAKGAGHGEVMASERKKMGVTNGLDLSPDGETLYVSESPTREVWAYRIKDATLTEPRLVAKFDGPTGSELDGLRTDIDGRIYVTRPGNGTVAVITPDPAIPPDKRVVRNIPLSGKNPTNLTFGGPDGMTVFVTQADGRFIETFRVDRPGREFVSK